MLLLNVPADIKNDNNHDATDLAQLLLTKFKNDETLIKNEIYNLKRNSSDTRKKQEEAELARCRTKNFKEVKDLLDEEKESYITKEKTLVDLNESFQWENWEFLENKDKKKE